MTRYSDILSEVYIWYKDQPVFDDWSRVNDVGLPLAYLSSRGFCEVTEEGQQMITESWQSLCNLLDLDSAGEYETLEAMFAASPVVKEK